MAAKYQIIANGRTWAVECVETGITHDRGGQGFTSQIDAEQFIKGCLISDAAPDMYAALKNLENDDNSIPEHAWKLVQHAIAKAEGE